MKRLEERFWAKVDIGSPEQCWSWRADTNTQGYGRFHLNASIRKVPAHRVAYELAVGPIPDGLQIDHLCRNRACVNPAHLEPVTSRVNTLRGIGPTAQRARQTECKHGHSLEGNNLYIDRRGQRVCRACDRDKKRRSRSMVANGTLAPVSSAVGDRPTAPTAEDFSEFVMSPTELWLEHQGRSY